MYSFINPGNKPRSSLCVVDVSMDSITISTLDGIEVVHWVDDEWMEDPSIVPAIANAMRMAYEEPETLLEINATHINSVRRMQND